MFRVLGAASDGRANYPKAVERWRALVREAAPDLDIDFLLTWIQHESGGQPCAVGIAGIETGLFQTFHPADDRYGATFAQLRTACDATANRETRPLTEAEKRLQVTTGINLVRGCRATALAALKAVGAEWGEQDTYCLTKLVHALPAYTRPFLRAFTKQLGQSPAGWSEFRGWVRGLSNEGVIAIDRAVRPWASVQQRDRLFGLSERAGSVVGRRGLPFEVPPGVRVLAAADGRVWSVERQPRGWAVVIDHGDTGYATFYTHLSESWLTPTQRAASGERVYAGQPLGLVGHDPLDSHKVRHLHFELWKGGPQNAVDPQPFMRAWEYLSPRKASEHEAAAPVAVTLPQPVLSSSQPTASAAPSVASGPTAEQSSPIRAVSANEPVRIVSAQAPVRIASADAGMPPRVVSAASTSPTTRNARLRYRPVGGIGEPYPEWVRELDGKSGAYVIREVQPSGAREVVYVGQSSSDRLYDTLTRHFQVWRRAKAFWRGQYSKHDPGLTYDRGRAEVAVSLTSKADALDEEARLIRQLRPRDNLLGQERDEEVPF